MPTDCRRRYLICYDIACNKRLARLARFCCKHATRLQYSVYEAQFTLTVLRQFESGLREVINGRADDVRIYGVHENREIQIIGQPRTIPGVTWVRDAAR